MRLVSLSSMLLLALALLAPRVQAGDLDPKQVPAGTQWLVHIDFDLVQKSKLWKLVEPLLQAKGGYDQKVREIETLAGMQYPRDLHDITIYSTSAQESDVAVRVGAVVDQERLLGMLTLSPGYSSVTHGKTEVLSWEDKGKTMFGAFLAPGRLIISQSKEQVEKAADLATGQADAIKDLPLPSGGPDVMVLLSGQRLSEWMKQKNPRNPMVGQLHSAYLQLSEQENDVLVKGKLIAKDAQAAEQIRRTLEGIKALLMLAAGGEQADEKTKLAAAAVDSAKVSSRESVVELDWKLPLAQVQEILPKLGVAAR